MTRDYADPPVLVCGGAGYIGSHMVAMLAEHGRRVVVVDNLSSGHADAVAAAPLERGDIGDARFIASVLERHRPDCVMHFAGSSLVAQSLREPAAYWRNNVFCTLVLLEAMRAAGVRQLVFSSTAAVYGEPERVPIPEDHPCRPINPYGHSKLAVEHLLDDFGRAHGLRSISLRYFNAAGAHPLGMLGERHEPETHLIPRVLQAAAGRVPHVARFGLSHGTPDGSCVRDFIHVQDLCAAHLLALERLRSGGASAVYNLGTGRGHSVTEVIDAARRVTGRAIEVADEPAREGDPPALVADASRARDELGWTPRYPQLQTMIAHAWAFMSR
ncbi:MAG TPA: UDP-glucose 4-epimerase GalE [Ramlibacter sp.]|uniref:UDP-glucose 4-epimerase GalE n=1 Tax=Ramlibacter sp. TaxID=1917967 RepID=UPI002BC7FE52|nr:UDP-glucose 4-epimerase GalE [Ramlibacter sp.]HVZ46572.1 UDP-glucose 4-epimerase GalE [Ramlibacter sp.]